MVDQALETSRNERPRYVKLRLKALIRTDEAFMIDLGQGKVWIPRDAIRSTRRIGRGIFEVEVLEEVIRQKREEMRRLKERATGVKGSVLGEVVEVRGKILKELADAYWIEFEGKNLYIPKVCFAELEELPEGGWRFVIQKNFLDYKLRLLASPTRSEAYTTVEVQILRETDRAYLFAYEGTEIWFPKREILQMKALEGERCEIKVPTDFWNFKLAGGAF